jgi:hypothetical protein
MEKTMINVKSNRSLPHGDKCSRYAILFIKIYGKGAKLKLLPSNLG